MATITREKAKSLVDTGEWMFDTTASDLISPSANSIWQTFFYDDQVKDKIDASDAIHRGVDLWNVTADILLDRFDHLGIENAEALDEWPAFRIRENYVLKINPVLREFTFKGLGVIIGVLMASHPLVSLLLLVAGLKDLKGVVSTLSSAWEHLEDPSEQTAFEAVFKLQGKLSIVNYDALENKDFASAYGHISPTFDDIEQEIADKLSKDDLVKTLAELKRREILEERNGRWSVKL